MTEPAEPDLLHLSNWVRWRRSELRLSQADVARRGGPSDTTLSNIEAAAKPAPRPSTLRKLDVALEWLAGSAALTLRGQDPVPLPTESEVRLSASSERGQTLSEGLLQVVSEADWADLDGPERYVADLESAVDLVVAAHQLLVEGHFQEAGQHIEFADLLFRWGTTQLGVPVGEIAGDVEIEKLTEVEYLLNYRQRRAELQFYVLRELIQPPLVGGPLHERPQRLYRSNIYKPQADETLRRLTVNVSRAMNQQSESDLLSAMRELALYIERDTLTTKEEFADTMSVVSEVLGPRFMFDVYRPMRQRLGLDDDDA